MKDSEIDYLINYWTDELNTAVTFIKAVPDRSELFEYGFPKRMVIKDFIENLNSVKKNDNRLEVIDRQIEFWNKIIRIRDERFETIVNRRERDGHVRKTEMIQEFIKQLESLKNN